MQQPAISIQVALLDYGQVKDLPDNLRLGYANLILAIADKDPKRASESYKELGIETLSNCTDEEKELFRLAKTMFDTKLPPGVTAMSPFADDSSLKKIGVKSFPEELFCILRTIQLLRGLSTGLGINYSCSEQWRPIAEAALFSSGRCRTEGTETRFPKKNTLEILSWEVSLVKIDYWHFDVTLIVAPSCFWVKNTVLIVS
ncbi:hypothetical protein Taro_015722 [Colocasia esculenta]|uniref:Uncharacterized protein n=1 Tax=Colocasia esculenta TaxID=4460 RepID=A0A843UC31_COLES|nr:hypothetical protein [Colocasia esculenta]